MGIIVLPVITNTGLVVSCTHLLIRKITVSSVMFFSRFTPDHMDHTGTTEIATSMHVMHGCINSHCAILIIHVACLQIGIDTHSALG